MGLWRYNSYTEFFYSLLCTSMQRILEKDHAQVINWFSRAQILDLNKVLRSVLLRSLKICGIIQVPLDSSQAYFWGHCKIGTNCIWFSDWLILLLIKLSLGQRCLMTWGKMSLQKVFFKLILLSSELFNLHAIYSLIRCDYDNCNNYLNQ